MNTDKVKAASNDAVGPFVQTSSIITGHPTFRLKTACMCTMVGTLTSNWVIGIPVAGGHWWNGSYAAFLADWV